MGAGKLKKFKYWLLLLILPVMLLSGCQNVTQRADTQDTETDSAAGQGCDWSG